MQTDTKTAENGNVAHAEELARDIQQDRGRWLAVNPQDCQTPEDLRLLQAAYLGSLKTTGWGKDLTPSQAFQLAGAARSTGLRPELGEMIMLGGNIYVTEDGCLTVANRHEAYDGYDIEPLDEAGKQAWGIALDELAFLCVVYRKDRKAPTRAVGHASERNVKMEETRTKWLSEMAQKRAVERAHCRAFALPFLGVDEPRDPTTNLSNDTRATMTIDSETGEFVPDAFDLKIAELKTSLRWTDARIEVEFKASNHDKAKLIERMEAVAANPRATKSKPPAPPEKPLLPLDEHAEGTAALDLEPPEPGEDPMTSGTRGRFFDLLHKLGIGVPKKGLKTKEERDADELRTKDERIAWCSHWRVDIGSFTELDEKRALWLCERAEEEGPDGSVPLPPEPK